MSEEIDKYLENILSEIERTLARGVKSIYRINDKASNAEMEVVKRYFANHPKYYFEVRKCIRCRGTWDVIINLK